MIYQLLAREFAKEERVTFDIAAGYYVFTEVFGKVIRAHHGDHGGKLKFEGGIGGITFPIRKRINEANKARRADLDVFGHWHTTIYDAQFVSNGSIMGYSEFSVVKGLSYEPPQQTFLLINKHRWITSFEKIFFAPRIP
jgi:hypothetical protein